MDEKFRSVVLWFSDATYEEIAKQAQPADEASQGANAWQEFRNSNRRRTETP